MAKIIKKSGFKLESFIVTNFSIKRFPNKQGNADLNINPSGLQIKDKNEYHLSLDIELKDNTESYDIKISVIGIFKYNTGESNSILSNYFFTNAPAIIFPYVRAYISSVSALTGLNTINLPVMNLTGLKKVLEENTQVKEEN